MRKYNLNFFINLIIYKTELINLKKKKIYFFFLLKNILLPHGIKHNFSNDKIFSFSRGIKFSLFLKLLKGNLCAKLSINLIS